VGWYLTVTSHEINLLLTWVQYLQFAAFHFAIKVAAICIKTHSSTPEDLSYTHLQKIITQ
jgi:hypothetical protein